MIIYSEKYENFTEYYQKQTKILIELFPERMSTLQLIHWFVRQIHVFFVLYTIFFAIFPITFSSVLLCRVEENKTEHTINVPPLLISNLNRIMTPGKAEERSTNHTDLFPMPCKSTDSFRKFHKPVETLRGFGVVRFRNSD